MNDCLFCKIVEGKIGSSKVYENEFVYAFFDIAVVNKYHTLVIPKNHYRDIYDIPENELKEVIAAVKKIAVLYKDKLGIENVQIINSSGSVAQQEVFHIHFHIVPRLEGDGWNIPWRTNAEFRSEFDDLLEKLK